jgi:DNA topoisomerase-3
MPTMGFVVDRYLQIRNFVPEKFWFLQVVAGKEKDGKTVTATFKWDRDSLYDKSVVQSFYDMSKGDSAGEAIVRKVKRQKRTKRKPIPLTTVELQKIGTRKLKMTGHEIMSIAEKLYIGGFISYPRTETDQFPNTINLQKIVGDLIHFPDRKVQEFIEKLQNQNQFEKPRAGPHNDQAHPPIHPVRLPTNLTDREMRVYDFITRHFLACCSKDAVAEGTEVEITIGIEKFHTSGVNITERNFLDVYPFDYWGEAEVPGFVEGERFKPKSFEMKEGTTTAPSYLTESDLIGLMEKNEIGTDSTIHEHIKTIQDRKYVFKQGMLFKPTNLGVSLIEAYNSIGIDLGKPVLRAEMEKDMKEIIKGSTTRERVVAKYQSKMGDIYSLVFGRKDEFVKHFSKYTNENRNLDVEERENERNIALGIGNEDGGHTSLRVLDGLEAAPSLPTRLPQRDEPDLPDRFPTEEVLSVMKCPTCGNGNIVVRAKKDGGFFLSCDGYPRCQTSGNFPRGVSEGTMTKSKCSACSKELKSPVYKVKLKFESKQKKATTCCLRCDKSFPGYSMNLVSKGEGLPRQEFLPTQISNAVIREQARAIIIPENKAPITRNDNSPPSGNLAQSSRNITCFRCKQVGHYANDCTVREKSPGKQSYNDIKPSTSNKGGMDTERQGGATGTCFKCGQVGHYANACPQGNNKPNNTKNTGAGTTGHSLENIECFRCKKKGHYASACPEKPTTRMNN